MVITSPVHSPVQSPQSRFCSVPLQFATDMRLNIDRLYQVRYYTIARVYMYREGRESVEFSILLCKGVADN